MQPDEDPCQGVATSHTYSAAVDPPVASRVDEAEDVPVVGESQASGEQEWWMWVA